MIFHRIKLLGTLTDANGRISLPSFCTFIFTLPCIDASITPVSKDDHVTLQTQEEEESYVQLAKLTGIPPACISSKWREPSLTIHSITASGSNRMLDDAVFLIIPTLYFLQTLPLSPRA